MTNRSKPRPGLTAEDAQLDRLMQAARPPRNAASEAALLERIVAAAEKSPRLVRVVALEATPAVTATPLSATAVPRRVQRDMWGAGGLLAASLVLGVWLGQSAYAVGPATRIEQVTGLTFATASLDALATLATDDDLE